MEQVMLWWSIFTPTYRQARLIFLMVLVRAVAKQTCIMAEKATATAFAQVVFWGLTLIANQRA